MERKAIAMDVDDLGVTFVYEHFDDSDVLHVFGSLSRDTSAEIENELVRTVRIGRTLVCDLRGCTYLDAGGVRVLARARRSLGTSLRLVVPEAGIVRRVLDVTGMTAAAERR